MKTKSVNIEYLRIKSRNYDTDGTMLSNNILSIKNILEEAVNIDVKDRIWAYKEEIARLQTVQKRICTYDNLKDCKNLWEIQFVRIRKDLLPGVADDDGSYDPSYLAQYLDTTKGLADSVSGIYDDDLCILLLQKNKDGILPSGALDYFKNVSNDHSITYDAIELDRDFSKINSNVIYKKLQIGIAELKPDTIINTRVKALTNIINSLKEFETPRANLVLSIGNAGKGTSMNQVMSMQAALDLVTDPHITTLKVKTKEMANSNIEEIDLLTKRLTDNFAIPYSKEYPITHDAVVNGLLLSYNNYRATLVQKLKG